MAQQTRFGVQQEAFPAEFAVFVGFVGGAEIDRLIGRVRRKLESLSPQVRMTLGDKYYFHDEFQRFIQNGFRLDTSRFTAVRAASLIGVVNHLAARLPLAPRNQLRSRVLDALDPGRDIREIEHELRCYTHLALKGHRVDVPVPSSDSARIYDWFVTTPTGHEVEVECKTISEDAGLQIKSDLRNGLYETFVQHSRLDRVPSSGLLTMQLRRPVAECKGLANKLKDVLASDKPLPYNDEDFTLTFEDRPAWQQAFDAGGFDNLAAAIAAELGNAAYSFHGRVRSFVAIIFREHKPRPLAESVVKVLRDAAQQFSKIRPSVIWLHFTGLGQSGFSKLIETSDQGRGFNAIAERVLLDRAGKPVRRHVERILFSADPDVLTRHPALAPNLMIVPSVSADGLLYKVANPHCSFPRSDAF